MKKADNREDLARAISDKEEYIEVSGDFLKGVVRIKATGRVAWVLAFGCIGVAVLAIQAMRPSKGAPSINAKMLAGGIIAPVGAISVLGREAALLAVGLVIASGQIANLADLYYKYDIFSQTPNSIILKRKPDKI